MTAENQTSPAPSNLTAITDNKVERGNVNLKQGMETPRLYILFLFFFITAYYFCFIVIMETTRKSLSSLHSDHTKPQNIFDRLYSIHEESLISKV